MHQKRSVFGILGLIAVASVYFFATQYIQSNKIITLQQKLNAQLSQICANGFTLSTRETGEKKEHFTIRLDDPEKASAYLTQKGIPFTVEQAQELQGLKLGVDLAYLKHTIALDLYPVALPALLHTILAQESDKTILVQFEEMLREKTLFAHIDINHSGTAFQGYLKDINETLSGEKEVRLTLQGFHFSGHVKNGKLAKLAQTFHSLHLYMEGEIDRHIYGLQHHYALTGPTVHDHTESYRIEEIKMNEAPEAELLAQDIYILSTSGVKNGLAEEGLRTKINTADLLFDKEPLGIKNFYLDMNISNIDIHTFETLLKSGSDQEALFHAPSEKRLSHAIHIDIPRLSVEKITFQGKEIDGFTLHSQIDIDSSADISLFMMHPEHVLSKMDATMELSLSKELLALINKIPKAMLLYMMHGPRNVSDQSIYNIHLQNGLMNINGKDLMMNGKPVRF